MTSDYYFRSLREALLKLERTPKRASAESSRAAQDQYESLRQLSRARIALALRQLRAAQGLSYAQVQTDTGLSQQLLFDMEFGDRRLTLEELKLLAACYKASINDILGIDID